MIGQKFDASASHLPTRVNSRDLRTSNISIWRYHCLGGDISEDLKSILITIWYSASESFVHLPWSSNLVYRSLESILTDKSEHGQRMFQDLSIMHCVNYWYITWWLVKSLMLVLAIANWQVRGCFKTCPSCIA